MADNLEPSGGRKNYITPQGFKRLGDELHSLLHVERPKVVETVTWAAGNGDRSENADYIYGKRRLREIDRRIAFLQGRLEKAVVVDPAQQKGDTVLFGATVEITTDESIKQYTIVGVDEIDLGKSFISWESPVGRALLGKKAGETVLMRTPRGEEIEMTIEKISYKSLQN